MGLDNPWLPCRSLRNDYACLTRALWIQGVAHTHSPKVGQCVNWSWMKLLCLFVDSKWPHVDSDVWPTSTWWKIGCVAFKILLDDPSRIVVEWSSYLIWGSWLIWCSCCSCSWGCCSGSGVAVIWIWNLGPWSWKRNDVDFPNCAIDWNWHHPGVVTVAICWVETFLDGCPQSGDGVESKCDGCPYQLGYGPLLTASKVDEHLIDIARNWIWFEFNVVHVDFHEGINRSLVPRCNLIWRQFQDPNLKCVQEDVMPHLLLGQVAYVVAGDCVRAWKGRRHGGRRLWS